VMVATTVHAQQKRTFESLVGGVEVAPVENSPITQVPFITWGGDVSTFVANGGLVTTPQSIYGKAGLNLKLVQADGTVIMKPNPVQVANNGSGFGIIIGIVGVVVGVGIFTAAAVMLIFVLAVKRI